MDKQGCYCANKNVQCNCDEVMDTNIGELAPIVLPIIQPVFLPSKPAEPCAPVKKPLCPCKQGDINCKCDCKCKCVNNHMKIIIF